ncbi:MAG: 2-oxoacid:acceptor oxidoreductase subunit alpha [Deltaproteobacteria bacterium]|nr:2-oxoacid:acceptor oxidoreductase subunit alpha [Deltaproteobacteria bacterium]
MMQGNLAVAEAAIDANCRFFAGYPITPSSEVAEHLSKRLPQVGGRFIQMEDEIAAMGAVIGASLGGVKSLTATSGPGYSLKQENIGYAYLTEVPVVIVNVMRGGPSTGLPTLPSQSDVMQAMWGTHGDHTAIALSPASVGESYDMTIRAFNLSEKFRMPVTLLLDEIIGHVYEKVSLPDPKDLHIVNRKKPTCPPDKYLPYAEDESLIPPMASFGDGYRYHVTGLVHDETGFPTNNPETIDKMLRRLHRKLDPYMSEIIEVEERETENAEIGIVTYGSSARASSSAMRAAREAGIKVGMLRLKTIWPFPTEAIFKFGQRVKSIIVPELNLGQIAHEVEQAIKGTVKVHKVNRINGEPFHPDEILNKIKECK